MASNIRLRMKLSDFINTDNEKKIMEMIDKTHTDLKNFLIRWEDELHFRTIVKQTSNTEPYEFVFFDIIPIDAPLNSRYRFAYTYTSNDKIKDGLTELYNCLKFIKLDRPPKRQKRNDYED